MPLNETQRAEMHTALTELHATISELLEDGAGLSQTVELDQDRMGRLSRMDAIQQQKMAQAVLSRHKIRLQRVEAALERLADEPEAFGECPECGEDIAHKRLQATPDAIFCISCAESRSKRR